MSKKLEYDKDKDHYPGPGTYNRFSEFGILAPRKKISRAKSANPNYVICNKKNSVNEIVERNAKRMFDRENY